MSITRTAGWYPDPITVGAGRYWDGTAWTSHVAYGGEVRVSLVPPEEVAAAADAADAAVVRRYLDDAVSRGVITRTVADVVLRDLDGRLAEEPVVEEPVVAEPVVAEPVVAEPVVAEPVVAEPVAPPVRPWRPPVATPPRSAPRPVAAAAEPAREPAPEPARGPSWSDAVSTWWNRAHAAVVTDLAVHGLAYLGVLLLFAGVFGLLYYSGEMRPGWRLVADVAAPAALFGAGWFLRRRGAETVGAALTMLGAVVLPLVVIASVTDGSSIPPDVEGTALPLVQAALCLAIAAAYALVVQRRPTTMLRFLVAPVAWLAVAVGAGVFRDPIPTGQAVAQASAMQLAALVAVVAATMLAIDVTHRDGPLASATMAVATPVAAVAYIAELIVAANEGWSVGSAVVVALGAAVVLHFTRWLSDTARAAGQVVVTVALLSGAAHSWALSWVAVVALAGLLAAETSSAGPPEQLTAHRLRLSAAAAALVVASLDPYAGVAAFAIAASWLMWDRVGERGGIPFADRAGLAPGAAMLGVVVESMLAWDPQRVALGVASAAAVLAAARPALLMLRRDRLWAWWPAAAGACAVVATAHESGGEWSLLPALTITAVAAAVALSGLPTAARVWFGGALATAAVLGWCSLLGLGSDAQAVVVAVGGLAGVIVAVVLADRVPSHVGWLGHALGFVLAPALASPWSPAFAASMSPAAAAWIVVTVAFERGGAHHVRVVRRWARVRSEPLAAAIDSLPVVMAFASAVVAAVAVADSSGWVSVTSPWTFAVASGTALLVAVAARRVRWRRGHPLVPAFGAVLTSIGVSVAAADVVRDDPWPVAVTLACGALAAASPRVIPVLLQWIGWALSVGVSLTTANALGLDRTGIALTVAGWGGAMLIGACAVERVLHGAAVWGTGFGTPAVRPPAWLGAAGLLVGSVVAVQQQAPHVVGWTSFGFASVVLVVALLRPRAPLVGLAVAGFTVAFSLIPAWRPFSHPWSFAVVTAVLLAGAALLRSPTDRDVARRWDLPLFWAAHGTALVAMTGALVHGSAVVTFASLAAMAFVIAFVLVHPAWWMLGGALALAAAASAGTGWMALALAVEGAVVTVLAARPGRWSVPLAMLGVVQELAAWGAFVVWRDWQPGTVALVSAPAAATVTLLAVVVAVRKAPLRQVAAVWAIASAITSLSAALGLFGGLDVGRLAGGSTAALSFALLAVAAAVATSIAGRAMSWLSVSATWGALAAAVYGLGPGPQMVVVLCSGVALAICTLMLVVQFVHPTGWAWQAAALAAGVQLGALGALSDVQSSKVGFVVLVLVAMAVETAAMALFLDVEWLFLASPVLSCVAWLVYAVDVAGAEPLALVVPAGLAVLVEAGIVRWVLRGRGQSATGAGVAALEMLGMVLVVGGFLGRMLVGSLWYSLGAIAAGTLLALWGATTKVRRRVLFGVAADLAAVVLLVAIPLSSVHPDWSGVTLWLVVAGVGAVAIAIAAFVERGKRAVRRWVDAVEEVTEDWERTGGADPHQQPAPRHLLADARQHQFH